MIDLLEGKVVVFVDGEIVFIFLMKYVIGFMSVGGIEILIYVGIDIVKLSGEGFEVYVMSG